MRTLIEAKRPPKKRLTTKIIQSLILEAVKLKRRLFYADGENGLCVRVLPSGRVSFNILYKNHKRERRERTIGCFPSVSIEQARLIAKSWKVEILSGRDIRPTLGEIYEDWLKIQRKKLAFSTLSKIEIRANKYILPFFKNCVFEDLEPQDFIEKWENISSVETLRRICLIVKELYLFAIGVGKVREMADLSGIKRNYALVSKNARHYKSIDYHYLSDLIGVVYAKTNVHNLFGFYVFLFSCLSLLRQKEIIHLLWDWVNFDKKVITIPAHIMKCRREFRLPITRQMELLLKALPKRNNIVFANTKRAGYLAQQYIGNLFRKLKINQMQSAHAIRTIGRSWMEENGIDDRVGEACISHFITNNAFAAYMRADFSNSVWK